MPETADEPLSGERISELLKLLKGADSVELKLTVPESDQRSAVAALNMDPLAAQIRVVEVDAMPGGFVGSGS